jgi:predicted enzyme involved in methoxymalonyl-ACP biosynthesis
MDCRAFPAPDEFWKLLEDLSDRFGNTSAAKKTYCAWKSIRAGSQTNIAVHGENSAEELLRDSEAELAIVTIGLPPDPRTLELLNKTNQFNLHGRRYTEASWLKYRHVEGSAWMAAYRDKFGALGKIAVLAGKRSGDGLS